MKMVSLKQPYSKITKSLLCPQHTKYNGNLYIGALVWRRDGNKSVVMIVDVGFCNSNNKKQQGIK